MLALCRLGRADVAVAGERLLTVHHGRHLLRRLELCPEDVLAMLHGVAEQLQGLAQVRLVQARNVVGEVLGPEKAHPVAAYLVQNLEIPLPQALGPEVGHHPRVELVGVDPRSPLHSQD